MVTEYFLYVNSETKLPEKLFFTALSKDMKKLYDTHKYYSFEDVSKYIEEKDLERNLKIIQNKAGKKFIKLVHIFSLPKENKVYIVEIFLELILKSKKYYIYKGINRVVNEKEEYKMLWENLIKNENIVLLKYDPEKNDIQFKKKDLKSVFNIKKEEIKKEIWEVFKDKIQNSKNFKEDVYLTFKNKILAFSAIGFWGIEKTKKIFFILLIEKSELKKYQKIYHTIKEILKNKTKLKKLIYSSEKRKYNFDGIILSNYEISKDYELKISLPIHNLYAYFSEKDVEFLKELKSFLIFEFNALLREKEIKNKSQLLKKVIDKSDEFVLVADENNEIIYMNKFASKVLKNIKNKKLNEIFFCDNSLNTQKHSIKKILQIKTNRNVYIDSKISKVKIDKKKYIIINGNNIIKKTQTNYEDSLTTLFNRKGFFKTLKNLEDHIKKFKYFIILDVAKFKILNHLKGPDEGDKILKKIGLLLKEYFQEDILARSTSDEFFILTSKDKEEIKEILDLISETELKKQLYFNAGLTKPQKNYKKMLEEANLALEIAKEENNILKNNIKIYNKNLTLPKEIFAKNLIDYAIQNNAFFYEYQPIFTKDKKIIAVEPLIRIKKDEKIYYPNSFIEFAERTGYISLIDSIMIETLLKEMSQLKYPLSVSFNLASNTIGQKKVFEKIIQKINLYKKKYPNLNFIFEITERTPLLHQYIIYLKKKGVGISLDDFGTGYSSLTYLSNLPVDKLKIDKCFVDKVCEDRKTQIVIESIIEFSHKLNVEVVAEGVETKEQFEILRKMNVDYFQGYYFSKPLPFDKFKKIIKM